MLYPDGIPHGYGSTRERGDVKIIFRMILELLIESLLLYPSTTATPPGNRRSWDRAY